MVKVLALLTLGGEVVVEEALRPRHFNICAYYYIISGKSKVNVFYCW